VSSYCEFFLITRSRIPLQYGGTTAININLKSNIPDRFTNPAKIFLIGDVIDSFADSITNVVTKFWLMSLGFNGIDISSMIIMNTVGTFLSTLPAGILADRYGKRKIILLGFLLFSVGQITILASTSFEMLSLAWFINGIGNGCKSVLFPLYSSFFNSKDMDRAFGLQGFLTIMASSLGSLMGFIPPLLVDRYSFSPQSSYYTMRAVGTAFFFISIPFYIKVIRDLTEPEIREGTRARLNLRSRSVVAKFSFLYMVGNIGYGAFFSLFPYYVNKKFGVQSDALGLLYFSSNFVRAVANIIGPRISKRIGTVRTIALSYVLCTPFWAMFPLAPDFAGISAIYLIRSGIGNLSSPLIGSLFMKLLYNDEKATANSIISIVSNGGNIVAPRLGGQLMEHVSLDFPAYLGSGIYAGLAAAYYLMLRNEKEKGDE